MGSIRIGSSPFQRLAALDMLFDYTSNATGRDIVAMERRWSPSLRLPNSFLDKLNHYGLKETLCSDWIHGLGPPPEQIHRAYS